MQYSPRWRNADAHGSGPCVRKDVRVQIPLGVLWERSPSQAYGATLLMWLR
jgi:hypothetical protein